VSVFHWKVVDNPPLVAALEARIADLEARIADLEARIADKERLISLKDELLASAINDRDRYRGIAAAATHRGSGDVDITSCSYKTVAEQHAERIHKYPGESPTSIASVPVDVLRCWNAECAKNAEGPPHSEKDVTQWFQPRLEALVRAFPETAGVTFGWHDTQRKPYLGGLEPDFTVTNGNVTKSVLRPCHVKLLVEFKLEGLLRDDVMGQLYVYAQHVFRAQPTRTRLIIIGADMHGVTRFDATVVGGGQLSLDGYESWTPWRDAAGVVWKALEDEVCHGVPCGIGCYAVDFCLGTGATSHVFQGCQLDQARMTLDNVKRQAVTVAIKRARELQDAADIRKEQELLSAIRRLFAEGAEGSDSIPIVVSVSESCDERPWFAMTPVGQLFDPIRFPLRRCHLQQLLAVLRVVHEAGYVHRDVRARNLVFSQANPSQVVLLDWAFAHCLADSDNPVYAGTLAAASDAVLTSSEAGPGFTHKSTACDDLHSLVRTVYLLLHPAAQAELAALPNFNVSDYAVASRAYKNFWAKHLTLCEVWRQACEAATKLQYDLLAGILPVLP
jgi:hypothetical protein